MTDSLQSRIDHGHSNPYSDIGLQSSNVNASIVEDNSAPLVKKQKKSHSYTPNIHYEINSNYGTLSIYETELKPPSTKTTLDSSSQELECASSQPQSNCNSTTVPDTNPKREEDIPEILDALNKHLRNEKKFTKAAKLLINCVEAKLNAENLDVFFDSFRVFVHSIEQFSNLNGSATITEHYKELVELIWSKQALIKSSIHCFELGTWYLSSVIQPSFSRDDAFEFTKLVKFLISSIHQLDQYDREQLLDESSDSLDESTSENIFHSRLTAIMDCLEVAFASYHWSWARTDIDKAFQTAGGYRHLFDCVDCPGIISRFDLLMTKFTMHQRKVISWTGPKTVRSIDSIAHPLTHRVSEGPFR